MITKIEFENYRIFKDQQTLEIRPITIIFGKNNSGKSAVLKLPSLIESICKNQSVEGFGTEINDVPLCEQYHDLIYNRRSSLDLKIGFENDQRKTTLDFYVDDNNKCVANDACSKDFENINFDVDYIGHIRYQNPPLDLRKVPNLSPLTGIDGANAYQHLIYESEDANSTLCQDVSDWYKENFDNKGILVDKILPTYRVLMRDVDSELSKESIRDCGTGIEQSLPIVVRACRKAEKDTLVVIEEPETHLHPSAHGALSELIAKSALKDVNKRYLIETHSKSFILRLRRMIAEEKLKKESVALYFVEYDAEEKSSSLRELKISDDGSVNWWPSGIFEEDMEDILVLARKQLIG